jgi:prevent-host-death family protein
MSITVKTNQAQQNFTQVMEQAIIEGEVVVERAGEPLVVILDYRRYQRLAQVEQMLVRARLQAASSAVSARAAHLTEEEVDVLIEQARQEVAAEGRMG